MFVEEFADLRSGDLLSTTRGRVLPYRDDSNLYELCLSSTYTRHSPSFYLVDGDIIVFVKHIPCSEFTTFVALYDGKLVICHRAWIVRWINDDEDD